MAFLLRTTARITTGGPSLLRQGRGFAAAADGAVQFDFGNDYKVHNCDKPDASTTSNKEEMLGYYELMYRMRRLEIANDNLYKAREMRGFCHLYDGQEAVAAGLDAALTQEDDIITAYRCHCIQLTRGDTAASIIAEMMGKATGSAKGKGGSMHLYKREHNFYGGNGIVGAQVPVGTGLGFAQKYGKKKIENCSVAMMGDGAANQGQVWEAANMASLWKLPVIYVIENNMYGMGTSTARSNALGDYYTMGKHIPGIWIDGMDILCVREGIKFAKEHCLAGKGPMFVEMSTYRYHGHSMSDPGITYRDRSEIAGVRTERDPIKGLEKRIINAGFGTPEDLKKIEKAVRKEIIDATEFARASSFPEEDQLTSNMFWNGKGGNDFGDADMPYIRNVEYKDSINA